jgi:hypothetical protein
MHNAEKRKSFLAMMQERCKMYKSNTMSQPPLTVSPDDPRRLEALSDLITQAKEYLQISMPNEFLRLESAELAIMLDDYLTKRRGGTGPTPVLLKAA